MPFLPLDITEAFGSGLRRDSRTPPNSAILETCTHLRATSAFALDTFETLTIPISAGELAGKGITVGHPFPQLFIGSKYALLADETKIYEIDKTAWTLTEYTTYDIYTPASTKSITAGGPWQFVDFHDTWFLFNGSCQVFHTNWVDSSKVFVQDTISINAGAGNRGVMFMGGFDETTFWNADWTAAWGTFIDKGVDYGITLVNPRQNFVWISRTGGGDLLHFFLMDLARYGLEDVDFRAISEHGGDRDYLTTDFMKLLSSRFIPMPWEGQVLSILPLGKSAIIYGENGVSPIAHDPNNPLRFGSPEDEEILADGIPNRGAAGGDAKRQVFVDNQGTLWGVSGGRGPGDFALERFGYEEYLSDLVGSDISITYDSNLGEWYISDATYCYVFDGASLSRSPELVTSVARAEGGLVGIKESAADSTTFSIKTGGLTFGLNDFKEVIQVDVDYVGVADLRVGLDCKFEQTGSFVELPEVPGSPQGNFYPRATGTQFKIRLRGTLSSTSAIKSVKVWYDAVGSRAARGPRTGALGETPGVPSLGPGARST